MANQDSTPSVRFTDSALISLPLSPRNNGLQGAPMQALQVLAIAPSLTP